ncbi:HigA family addiction module antitoxin [Rhodoglobus sp. NPDC076762]
MHNPPHPGILLEDYLGDISFAEAARPLGVAESRLALLRDGQESVSAELAARLGMLLGTSAELWLGLQAGYDRSAASSVAQ